MVRKRRFGRVRQLPSGRYQVRYPGPDGVDRPADRTFPTKKDAERWLSVKETEIIQGDWTDPDTGKVTFADYARAWIDERPNLRPKTLQLYNGLLDRHLLPAFGQEPVSGIREAQVRRWRKARLDAGVGSVTVAKAYRLLKAVLNTAVDDGLIRRNPCRIKGASKEPSPERPLLTFEQVYSLADVIGPRYRALVLLATFAGLRWGELIALRRRSLDLEAMTVRVEESTVELKDGSRVTGPPKSAAGVRTVALPSVIIPDLRWHLQRFAESGSDGLVFVGAKGAPLRSANFSKHWHKARVATGVPEAHFHDLRHAGNTMAAATGVSLRELMSRMGHASTRAALIYQHATSDRDRAIADALSTLAEGARQRRTVDGNEDDESQSGT